MIIPKSVRKNIVYKLFLMPFITLRNNRNISLKNSNKNLWILPIVKVGIISPGRKYNVWRLCGNHILIKFFCGCIIDIQINFKKKRQEPASESLQATECIFTLFSTNIVDVRVLCVQNAEDVRPPGAICGYYICVGYKF